MMEAQKKLITSGIVNNEELNEIFEYDEERWKLVKLEKG